MLLSDAIRKAEKDESIKKLSKDHFLCSAFAFVKNGDVKEWILHFFSPKRKKMVDCFVSDSVNIGEETPAIKDMQELDPKKVKVSSAQVLEIVKKRFDKKAVSSMISLHKKRKTIWTINMITQDMMVTKFDIDALNGEIINEEKKALIIEQERIGS